jgi:hypothetical protein
MITALSPTTIAALLIAQTAATQPPPERPTDGAMVELLVGVGAGSLATSAGVLYWGYTSEHRKHWGTALPVGLLAPPVAMGITLFAAGGQVRPSVSQALNGGIFWTTLHLTLPDIMDERFPVQGLLVAPALGLGLGALGRYALDPTSGQVSAFNSGGLIATTTLVMLQPRELDPLTTLLIIDAGLVLGATLAAVHPRSRTNVLAADALAYVTMLAASLFVSDHDNPLAARLTVSAIPSLVFLAAYRWLPELGGEDDAPLVQLQITSGDALFRVPGERQGGLGVTLSMPF